MCVPIQSHTDKKGEFTIEVDKPIHLIPCCQLLTDRQAELYSFISGERGQSTLVYPDYLLKPFSFERFQKAIDKTGLLTKKRVIITPQ